MHNKNYLKKNLQGFAGCSGSTEGSSSVCSTIFVSSVAATSSVTSVLSCSSVWAGSSGTSSVGVSVSTSLTWD